MLTARELIWSMQRARELMEEADQKPPRPFLVMHPDQLDAIADGLIDPSLIQTNQQLD